MATGWLLGGTLGLGTVLYAVARGRRSRCSPPGFAPVHAPTRPGDASSTDLLDLRHDRPAVPEGGRPSAAVATSRRDPKPSCPVSAAGRRGDHRRRRGRTSPPSHARLVRPGFSRDFRAVVGTTPSAFLQRARQARTRRPGPPPGRRPAPATPPPRPSAQRPRDKPAARPARRRGRPRVARYGPVIRACSPPRPPPARRGRGRRRSPPGQQERPAGAAAPARHRPGGGEHDGQCAAGTRPRARPRGAGQSDAEDREGNGRSRARRGQRPGRGSTPRPRPGRRRGPRRDRQPQRRTAQRLDHAPGAAAARPVVGQPRRLGEPERGAAAAR